ncbi:hypothetical protein EV648_1312 [Kribbella sp. VKM Ac-2568]|nr:hypothetical protein EV648_1312 [Kribbella sp. VKM Ac-2568]
MEPPPRDHPGVVWKPEDVAVAAGNSIDIGGWLAEFDGLMARIAGRFARVESRLLARDAVAGLMSDLAVKNCWTLAEHAGHDSPDGLQHQGSKGPRFYDWAWITIEPQDAGAQGSGGC